MKEQSNQIAKDLLDIEAIFLRPNEPFTWASGIKSPIYCDNRITMSYPHVRRAIAKGLAAVIKKTYPEAEVIAGTATAGIPHAAWVAELLDLPMVYIRSKAKEHGKGNQIEGRIQPNQKMVVIEDLLSTGGSVVLGVAAIFTYELPQVQENFDQAGLSYVTLTNYTALIESALETGAIQESDVALLQEWRKDPAAWLSE